MNWIREELDSRRFRLWDCLFQVIRNSDRYLSTAPFPLAKVLFESVGDKYSCLGIVFRSFAGRALANGQSSLRSADINGAWAPKCVQGRYLNAAPLKTGRSGKRGKGDCEERRGKKEEKREANKRSGGCRVGEKRTWDWVVPRCRMNPPWAPRVG